MHPFTFPEEYPDHERHPLLALWAEDPETVTRAATGARGTAWLPRPAARPVVPTGLGATRGRRVRTRDRARAAAAA